MSDITGPPGPTRSGDTAPETPPPGPPAGDGQPVTAPGPASPGQRTDVTVSPGSTPGGDTAPETPPPGPPASDGQPVTAPGPAGPGRRTLAAPAAVLDEAHLGDIEGALGRIRLDHEQRSGWRRRLVTFLAIIGPGLIVMVGDNDAGGVSTYAQAGQDYGYTLAVGAAGADPGAQDQGRHRHRDVRADAEVAQGQRNADGLLTTAVQALAGVLLPSASVFLLLLCNDPEVLGPWVNRRWLNVLASVIIGVLLTLSRTLVVTTLFPHVNSASVAIGLAALLLAAAAGAGGWLWLTRSRRPPAPPHPRRAMSPAERQAWRMPPLALLKPVTWSPGTRLGMLMLRGYLLISVLLLIVKAVQLGGG